MLKNHSYFTGILIYRTSIADYCASIAVIARVLQPLHWHCDLLRNNCASSVHAIAGVLTPSEFVLRSHHTISQNLCCYPNREILISRQHCYTNYRTNSQTLSSCSLADALLPLCLKLQSRLSMRPSKKEFR